MRFLRHNTSSAIFLVYSELCSAYCGQTVCQKGHLATTKVVEVAYVRCMVILKEMLDYRWFSQ